MQRSFQFDSMSFSVYKSFGEIFRTKISIIVQNLKIEQKSTIIHKIFSETVQVSIRQNHISYKSNHLQYSWKSFKSLNSTMRTNESHFFSDFSLFKYFLSLGKSAKKKCFLIILYNCQSTEFILIYLQIVIFSCRIC